MAGDKDATTIDPTIAADFHAWGAQTCIALGGGFVFGFVKGYRETPHLAGKYGPDNVYRGVWADFRVPLRVMHATGSSVLWGGRVCFFASTFSAIQIFLNRKRKQFLEASSNATETNDRLRSILSHEASSVLPTVAAGTVVGGMFGWAGGLGGIIKGSSAGLALSASVGGLQFLLEKTTKELEARLESQGGIKKDIKPSQNT